MYPLVFLKHSLDYMAVLFILVVGEAEEKAGQTQICEGNMVRQQEPLPLPRENIINSLQKIRHCLENEVLEPIIVLSAFEFGKTEE